jgi:hypothetical protein
MDTQSIIECLEALKDKMTPEQLTKLKKLKKDWDKQSTRDKLKEIK